MVLPLLVGNDGSRGALRAVDWAADEAELRGAPLRIVHAALWAHYESRSPAQDTTGGKGPELVEDTSDYARARSVARHPGIDVTVDERIADPVETLVRDSDGCSAIVLGRRGRGPATSVLLGSVSRSVAARARCPVIVVGAGHGTGEGTGEGAGHGAGEGGGTGRAGRVVLGLGRAYSSRSAARFAFEEAALRGWELEVVHARTPARVHVPGLGGSGDDVDGSAATGADVAWERLDADLAAPVSAFPEVIVHRTTVEGSPRSALLAATGPPDLLVVGVSRRRRGVGRRLGPVNQAVLHHAPCPVTVVPGR